MYAIGGLEPTLRHSQTVPTSNPAACRRRQLGPTVRQLLLERLAGQAQVTQVRGDSQLLLEQYGGGSIASREGHQAAVNGDTCTGWHLHLEQETELQEATSTLVVGPDSTVIGHLT